MSLAREGVPTMQPCCLLNVLIVGLTLLVTGPFLTDVASSPPPSERAAQVKDTGPRRLTAAEITALIDKLADVAESDFGYSASVTGTRFLPLDCEGQFQTGLLGQRPSHASSALRELVRQGAHAQPQLLAHLDDKRRTKVRVKHNFGLGGLLFGAACDYNPRTEKEPTYGKEEERDRDPFGPKSYTVAVGDLCFVAVGQIVKRPVDAMRYPPPATITVTPPRPPPAPCRAG